MHKGDSINIYNGVLSLGFSDSEGMVRIGKTNYTKHPLRTLFRLFGRSIGVVALVPLSEWVYKEEFLNALSATEFVKVVIVDYKNYEEEEEAFRPTPLDEGSQDQGVRYPWNGSYPDNLSPEDGSVIIVENISGDCIGSPDFARCLLCKGIIHFEKITPNRSVCSIGFDGEKWWGWSHRAIASFGIGYVAEADSLVTSSGWTDEYYLEHPDEDFRVAPGFKAENFDDCKRLAMAFAEAVG